MSPPDSTTATTLREFLTSKADEYGVRGRNQRRKEWLGAVDRLFVQLQSWMREADPEGLLDVIRYDVSRTERDYGTYDAPALQVRFGPEEVSVEPIYGHPPLSLTFDQGQMASSPDLGGADISGGRVDASNGLRTYHLFRERGDEADAWWIWDGDRFAKLDPASFGRILKDLLS